MNLMQEQVSAEHQFDAANLHKTLSAISGNNEVPYLQARNLIEPPRKYHLAAPHVNFRGGPKLDLFFTGEADATGAIRVVITNSHEIFEQEYTIGNYELFYADDSKLVILRCAERYILIGFFNASECQNFVALFRSGLPSAATQALPIVTNTGLRLTLRFE